MDRRLKIYRELNPLDSGNTTKDFLIKAIGAKNTAEFQADMVEEVAFSKAKQVVEQAGKPCCLDLINEKDNKFLADLEKEKQRVAKEAEGGQEQEEAEEQEGDETK